MKKFLLVVCLMFTALCAWAYKYTSNGTVTLMSGKHVSIVVEYDNSGASMVGRYAYKSTLQKYGKKSSSYLYFYPDGNGNWVVQDYQGNIVEYWYDFWYPCRMNGWNNTIKVETTKGKKFTISFQN